MLIVCQRATQVIQMIPVYKFGVTGVARAIVGHALQPKLDQFLGIV